jgi:hypothetical protein
VSLLPLYTCLFGLDQHNNSVVNSALLDLVFSNISDLSVSISSAPVVTRNKFHPPLPLDYKLTFDCYRASLTPHRSYVQGDYLLFYNVLHHSRWSYVLNVNSVVSAVYNLTA